MKLKLQKELTNSEGEDKAQFEYEYIGWKHWRLKKKSEKNGLAPLKKKIKWREDMLREALVVDKDPVLYVSESLVNAVRQYLDSPTSQAALYILEVACECTEYFISEEKKE